MIGVLWAPLGEFLSLNLARRPCLARIGFRLFGVLRHFAPVKRDRGPHDARGTPQSLPPAADQSCVCRSAPSARSESGGRQTAWIVGRWHCPLYGEAASYRETGTHRRGPDRRRGCYSEWRMGGVRCVRGVVEESPIRPASSVFHRSGSSAPAGCRRPETLLPGSRCCCDETRSRRMFRPGCDGS